MGKYNDGAYSIGIINNPLTHSVYVNDEYFIAQPPVGMQDLITEGGDFIMTESANFLTTE